MAPAHAARSVTAADAQMPDVVLTFAAPTACAAVRVAPESELLLPARDTSVRVEKSDAKSGCKLRVEAFRTPLGSSAAHASAAMKELSEDGAAMDAFDIAAAVSANMALASRSAHLRGAGDLVLEHMLLQVASKRYDVVLRSSEREKTKAAASTMVLYGAKCSPQLRDAALVLPRIVPPGVDAGELNVQQSDDVAVAKGHELDCAAVLDITARAPLLLADSVDDALSYLRAFDANLDDTFEVSARKRVVATVELHASSSSLPPAGTELLADAAARYQSSPYNAPTKEMTLGILAGLFGLVAMLVAVAMKKKSHEKQCEEHYRNASKAAQIRRVSIRMASSTRTRDVFGEEDEEEKEEYREHDGLL